jgi:hypothetical protein
MSFFKLFYISASKVFSKLYQFIKVDEMLQEYELNKNVIESKLKSHTKKPKKVDEDLKNMDIILQLKGRSIINEYDFEKKIDP